jgi:hypothetical protein
MSDLIIRPKMPETCGGCRFSSPVPQNLQLVVCRGAPPTPVIVGQTPQGLQVESFWPSVPRGQAPCALWKAPLPVSAEDAAVTGARN